MWNWTSYLVYQLCNQNTYLVHFRQGDMKVTYFNFFTTNLLGPFTHRLENVAVKSGPCLKWIFSRYNGSSGIVLNPSPKSPSASGCLNFSTSANRHGSGFGKFREQAVIDDAVRMIESKQIKMMNNDGYENKTIYVKVEHHVNVIESCRIYAQARWHRLRKKN